MSDLSFVTARALGLSLGGVKIFSNLSFSIGPGLTWVRGGDGSGKTSLLRILGGQLEPTAGVLHRNGSVALGADALGIAHDKTVAGQWLAGQQALQDSWDKALAQALLSALDLQDHVHKPLYMLSAGSRRKLGLAAAVASRAPLTLLDTPYAALDARACAVLDELMVEAVEDRHRAWVVADYQAPAGLPLVDLAACIDLGDLASEAFEHAEPMPVRPA